MKWKPHHSGAYIYADEGYMVTYTVTKSYKDERGKFVDTECCYVAIHNPDNRETSSSSTILCVVNNLKISDEQAKKKARLELRAICEKHFEESSK